MKKSCRINLLKLIETETISACIKPEYFIEVAKYPVYTESKTH
jgi:hypothetical protein